MKNSWLILLALSFLSCKSLDKAQLMDSISIIPNIESVKINELFSEVNTIKLVGEELPFSIYRVLPIEKGFFLLDGQKEKIFKVTSDGETHLFLNSKGEGPSQYLEIWDMKYDFKSSKLFILDRKLSKLLIYHSSSKEFEEFPIKKEFISSILSFGIIKTDEVVFQTSGSAGYKFLKFNLSKNEYTNIVEMESEFNQLGFGNDKSMNILENSISVIYPLSGKIEKYDFSFTREADIHLDFKNYSISPLEIEKVNNDQNRMFDLIQNDDEKRVHSFLLEESKNYFLLSYYLGSFRNGFFLKSLVNKSTGDVISFKDVIVGDESIDFRLIGRNRMDEFIFTLNSEELEKISPSSLNLVSRRFKVDISPDHQYLIFCRP